MAPTARILSILVAASLLASTTALAASLAVTSARLTTFVKTYGAAVTCSLGATADAYVDHATPTTNQGTAVILGVGSSDLSLEQRTVIRFDLTTCSPAIPAGAIVQSAKLRLVTTVLQGTTRTYDVNSVTASWTEGTVNWNNQPGVADAVTASTTVTSLTPSGSTIEWNVLSNVQSFVIGDSTNNGWRVTDSAETSGTATISFNSREASSGRPALVITYVS